MNDEDPDLLAGEALDKLRGRNPYPAMSERFRLSEELDNARYQNNLLTEKCRQLQERIEALQNKVEATEKINTTLTSALDKLRRERDEARRIACENEAVYNGMMYDNPKYSDPIAVMREHGWDCFKENTND